MKKWKWYIFIILILITILIVVALIKRTDIKYLINEKTKMNMSILAQSNSWDISKSGNGSVMATLSEDGTLTISGTGEMKGWGASSVTDWHNKNIKELVKKVIINYGVRNIGDSAFYNCSNLSEISIPKGVESIEGNAFSNCIKLTEVEIPEGVTSIGIDAFLYCSNLKKITIPESVRTIGKQAFYRCSNLSEIQIPKGITAINDNTFASCTNLKEVQIPEGVTSIGYGVFDNCDRLSYIDIPDSVISIGDRVFSGCKNLRDIEIPKSVSECGNSILIGSQIYIFTNGKDEIGLPQIMQRALNQDDIFYANNQFEVKNCSINGENIILDKENEIGSIKILEGKLDELTINIIPLEISLTKTVKISVNENGEATIFGTGEIDNIPEVIRNIITKISIESEITKVSNAIFVNCINLEYIEVDLNNKNYIDDNGVLYTKDKRTIICYPRKKEGENFVVPEGTNNIMNYCFYYCSYLKNITLPDEITEIKYGTFEWCTSLLNLVIPDKVTKIDGFAFYGCINLMNINLPEGITSIGSSAFYNCNSLEKINIPEGITSIKYATFENCYDLKDIELPDTITSIDVYAFENCYNLTNIHIPDGVTSIGNHAFSGCNSLTNISLPNSIKSIADYTFSVCTSLEYIEIPNGVISIGNMAFYNCSKLSKVIIPKTVTTIASNAFQYTENVNILCASNSTAESYAIENGLNYTLDDIAPNVEISNNGTNNPEKQINTTVTVTDNLSGVSSTKYLWSTKSENVEENEITNVLEEGQTITTPKVTGEYYLWVLVEDKVGNKAIARSNAFILDNTAPTLEIENIPETYTNGNVTVKIKANEQIQEIEGWTLSNDKQTLTKEYNDNTEETITVRDLAGNETNAIIQINKIDKEIPTIRLSQNGTTEAVKEANIEVAATDNLSGIKSIKYLWSIESEDVGENDITNVLEEESAIKTPKATGQYYLWVLVKDNAGNNNKLRSNIFILDNIAPEIKISQNGTTETIKSTNTKVTAADNLSGVSSTKYLWSTKSENVAENEIINVLEEGNTITTPKVTGEYYLWVLVEDNAGNKAIARSNAFILDNTAPTLEIENIPETYTNGNVTVKIKANEQIQEIEGWTLSSDKQILTKEYNDNTEETITVMDLVGNETNANIRINKIDRESPTIRLSQNGTTEAVKEANIEVTATDNLSGIKSIKYLWSIESEDVGENNITNVLEEENEIATPEATGEYYLWVLVEDNAGNKNKLRSNVFMLDNTAPVGEVTYNISKDKDMCLVTIKSNKELEEIEGWTLTSDRLTLTKKYYENTEETITIKDKIGNTAAIKIEITGIEVPTFNVQGYKINGLYIRNIQPQTVYSNFIKNIVTNQSYEIKEGNITITGIDKIKTGQKLILKNTTYTLVVTGDINGDGDIKLSDLSTLKMQLIGKRSLTGASKEAGDINEDGDIKLSDLSKMKKILIE